MKKSTPPPPPFCFTHLKQRINYSIFFLLFSYYFVNNLSAQGFYGQIKYLTDSTSLTTGSVMVSGTGFLMGSVRVVRQVTATTSPDFVITRTDDAGGFSNVAANFHNGYQIYDNFACGTATAVNNCYCVSLTETTDQGNGEAYAGAGTYTNGVFFFTLDALGNVITTQRWFFPNPWAVHKVFIRASLQNPGEYYICGDLFSNSYVIKVDYTGTSLWAWEYSSNVGITVLRAISEHPSQAEIVVVGTTDGPGTCPNATAGDGLFMRLDATNGTVIDSRRYNTFSDGDEIIDCIQWSITGNFQPDGYMIGGKSYYPLQPQCNPCNSVCSRTLNVGYNLWMAKMDYTGGIVWSSLIEPSAIVPTFSSSITDILTRVNTNSNPEHYGVCDDGSSVAMFKLDNSGNNTISPDEFHYNGGGALGYWPWGNVKVSGIDGWGNAKDGVQIFAPFINQHLIKTYFNGVSGCAETSTTMTSVHPGPTFDGNITFSRTGLSTGCANVFSLNVFAITPTVGTVCTATTLGTGSNAKIGQINSIRESESGQIELINVSPNPSSGKTTIKFNGSTTIKKIQLVNSVGQTVFTQQINKNMSGEELELNLQNAFLNEGIYYLKVSSSFGEKNYKLIFKN